MSYTVSYKKWDDLDWTVLAPGAPLIVPYDRFGVGNLGEPDIAIYFMRILAAPGHIRDAPTTIKVGSSDIAIRLAAGSIQPDWGVDYVAEGGIDDVIGNSFYVYFRRNMNGTRIDMPTAIGFPSTGFYIPIVLPEPIWYVPGVNGVLEDDGLRMRTLVANDVSTGFWWKTRDLPSAEPTIESRLHLFTAVADTLAVDLGYSSVVSRSAGGGGPAVWTFDIGATPVVIQDGQRLRMNLETRVPGGDWGINLLAGHQDGDRVAGPVSDGSMRLAGGPHSFATDVYYGTDDLGSQLSVLIGDGKAALSAGFMYYDV